MGKTRGMGSGRCSPRGRPLRRFRPRKFRERALPPMSLASLLRTKNTLGSKISNQDQTTLVSGTDIQGQLSSDVVTSTSKPQTPSSRLDGMKKTLVSEVSSLLCSACMERIQSVESRKGSDQDHTTLVSEIDIQESSDIVSSTSKPLQGKHLRSSSKMHKPKAKKNKKRRRARDVQTQTVSTT